MKPDSPADYADPTDEIASLVKTLHETQRRLLELTGGQVDAVLHPDGQSYLLHQAQEDLQTSEAAHRDLSSTQAAILNALPAYVALLDSYGVIVAVNDGWRSFALSSGLQSSAACVGQNYLQICEQAQGDCAEEAIQTAAGIREVLAGVTNKFSLEYPCHSPAEKRWFQLMVTPLDNVSPSRAAVMHIDITTRKLAEEAIQQSEQKFHSMFTAAAIGIAITTPAGRYLHANEAYCRMLGYSEEELLAVDFLSLTHPDDVVHNLNLREEVLTGRRKSFVMEKRYLKKDGSVVWSNASVSATYSGGGAIETCIVVAEDITKRKQAENALLVQTERLDLATRTAGIGIWDWNLEKNDLVWDDRMYALYGIRRGDFTGAYQAWLSGLHPEDREESNEVMMRAIRGEAEFDTEFRVQWPDRSTHTIKASGHVIRNEEGHPVRVIGVNYDISESRLIQDQLHSKTAMFEAQVRSSLDGIMIVSSEGRKILQNQKMADLWEIPADIADDLDDETQVQWVTERVKNPDKFVEKVAYLNDHPDEISRDEVELLNGNSLERYSAPVRDSNGKYYGRIWVFRDITERKKAERQTEEQMQLLDMAGSLGKLGAWSLELPGRKLVWSDEVYRLHQVDPSYQPELSSALGFYPPAARAKIEAAIEVGNSYDIESEFVTAKGNKRWVRTTSAVEMKDGKSCRLYGIFQDITDQKKSEMRFRRLVDSNAQGVFIWNRDGAISEANDAFLNIVGYTAEDLKSEHVNWKQLTPSDQSDLDDRALQELADRGICTPFEKAFRRKDGSRVPVLLGAALFEDNPNEGICFVLDLTARKLAEEAQRLSEERFSHAFEYAPNGMIIVTPEGKVITANRTMCELLGFTLDELSRKRFEEFTHPDDLSKELDYIRRVFASEMNIYQMEKRYLHRDGHPIWTQMSSSLVRDANDEPLYFIKQVQDITEMKRAYHQIEEQAALIDEASDAIFSRDLEHRILFWSKGAERTFGWKADEAKGKVLKDLSKIDPVKFAEANKIIRETGQWNGEFQKQTKSGTALTVNTRWTLLRDADGQPHSILTIDTDVTERRRLEQQFLRAQRMESIGTLAGGIAHDLNNILAPIMMSIDVLRSLSDKPEASEILETIRVSAKRGSEIVRQVLSFARGMEGKRVEVQFKHILEDVEHIVKNTFPKNFQVRTDIPRNTWTILGDPTQIHQILLNLCVNARDAMPNGGTLNLTAQNFILDDQYSVMSHQGKPGPYVQISVTDTGTGIPPELLERIFEPFFTTKDLSKGTGLGLSTVMAIVKSHEGMINVYSELGKGTTFKVYLPAVEISPEKRKVQTQSLSLPRGNGETILIVDDEASILTITSQTLLAFGYRVLQATDGAEAVGTYAQHRHEVAVVLTDMMMPVLDGSALIQALKRMNPAVKIIAASGLNADVNASRVTGAGVNHFLTKPYTAGTLLQTLREILSEN
jgi:PAS domain S-box-containing protein